MFVSLLLRNEICRHTHTHTHTHSDVSGMQMEMIPSTFTSFPNMNTEHCTVQVMTTMTMDGMTKQVTKATDSHELLSRRIINSFKSCIATVYTKNVNEAVRLLLLLLLLAGANSTLYETGTELFQEQP